jgi:hypothetical protein
VVLKTDDLVPLYLLCAGYVKTMHMEDGATIDVTTPLVFHTEDGNVTAAVRRPGQRRWPAKDGVDSRGRRSFASRLASPLLAFIMSVALAAAIVLYGGTRGVAVLVQRGDRDVLGDWRISRRYRTLWQPGENTTKLCKQNPWPGRVPARSGCGMCESECVRVFTRARAHASSFPLCACMRMFRPPVR